MPLYSYQCREESCPNCGIPFERVVRMAAADEVRCEGCEQLAARDVIGGGTSVRVDTRRPMSLIMADGTRARTSLGEPRRRARTTMGS